MTPPIRARLDDPLVRQIEQACPTNTSAGLRALLLIGLGAAGVDMRPFQRPIRRTLVEDLQPAVAAALRALLDGSDRPAIVAAILPAPDASAPADEPDDDPLLSVGMDF